MRKMLKRVFFASLLVAFHAQASITVAHVGTTANLSASSTPQIQWNLSPLPTVGNSLIVVWTYANLIGVTGTPTIADNQGTTANWHLATSYINPDSGQQVATATAIFYLPTVSSSSGSFQVTISTPASTAASARANHIEVTSSTGAIAVDQTGTYGSGTGTPTSVTVTSSSANAQGTDFVVPVFAGFTTHSATYSTPPSTGYTLVMSQGSSGYDLAAGSGYKTESSSGVTSTANVTVGTGMEASASIATFYAYGGAPPSGQSNLLTLGVARNTPHPSPRDLYRWAAHESKRAT